jgi:hypothetical protein
MKYLVLSYDGAKDWSAPSQDEQESLLAQDEVLRRRGSLVAAVENAVTTVRTWDRTSRTTEEPFSPLTAPLAGFGVIEADDLNHGIQFVAHTHCARAKGAVEIRPILCMNPGAAGVL